MSENYKWKILQDGLTYDEVISEIGEDAWTVYRNGTVYSSGSTSEPSLNGITLKKNNNRCHDTEYSILWSDANGNTASGTAVMLSCAPPPVPLKCYDIIVPIVGDISCMGGEFTLRAEEKPCFDDSSLEGASENNESDEYRYSIKVNGKTSDAEGNFSGNCSGETEIFKAWCIDTQNYDQFGTWTVWKVIDDETEYIEHGPSEIRNGRFEYPFIENTTTSDVKYRIVFESECIKLKPSECIKLKPSESAFTYYTVVSSDECMPCETPTSGINFNLPSETVWADMNVDACRIYSGGNYYAWASEYGLDMSESSAFTISSYTLYNLETSGYTMYNDKDGLRMMKETIYDSKWTVPTPYHFQELTDDPEITLSNDEENKRNIFSKQIGDELIEMIVPKIGGYLHDGRKTATLYPYFWTSYISGDSIDSAITCCISGSSLVYQAMPRYYGSHLRLIKEKRNNITFTVYGKTAEGATKTNAVTFNVSRNGSTESITFTLKLMWYVSEAVEIGKIYEPFSINYVEKIVDDKGNILVNNDDHSKIQITFREGYSNKFIADQFISITIN